MQGCIDVDAVGDGGKGGQEEYDERNRFLQLFISLPGGYKGWQVGVYVQGPSCTNSFVVSCCRFSNVFLHVSLHSSAVSVTIQVDCVLYVLYLVRSIYFQS